MRILWRLLLTLVVAAVLAIGVPWLIVQGLAAGRTTIRPADAEARDVVLVMGAATYHGRPSPYLQGRLDVAVELWRLGKVKVFIVSGSTSDDEPAVMRQYLQEQGVDPADIVEDTGGNDSYASCMRAAQMFGLDRVTVVSQSYHVPRTVATCRMVGLDAIGVGDDARAKDATWRSYERRELIANLKLIVDVVTGREVGQSQADSAVLDAVARHR